MSDHADHVHEQDAPDTHASAQITDHVFQPVGEWWSVCRVCRLGRAAHAYADPDHERPEEVPTPLPVAEVDKSVMEEHVVKDAPLCGAPGPAPDLSCEFDQGHEGLHFGYTPHSDDPIRWGEPPAAEQDDPIGGGRIQELLQDSETQTRGQALVDGERQENYGSPVPNMERVARGWSIITESQITPHQACLMMIWLKVVRESQVHLEANVEDIEGYAEIMRRVVQELGT